MIRRALLLLLTLTSFSAFAGTLPLQQYLTALQHLDELIATNQNELASAEAQTLSAYDIDSPFGPFHADESLLSAVSDSRVPRPQVRARLALTMAELRRATGVEGTPADRKLLAEIAKEQEPEELRAGGEVLPVRAEIPMIEQILQTVQKIFDWIAEKLGELLDWLLDLFPAARPAQGSLGGIRWIVGAVALLIVFAVLALAISVIRRSSAASVDVVQSADVLSGAQDADPLSRGANDWERYAIQLAREGRTREAIRAWFHAVLVTCYAEGILHFRKGRTNWEYIAALSPSYSWRPELIALTRRFEQEWYGSDTSTEEALDDCASRARRILDALHESGGLAA